MKKMVSEDVHDFMDPEIDPELSAIEAVEDDEFPEDENGEEYIDYEVPTDKIIQTIKSEISIPEYSRKSLSVMLKNGEVIDGVAMAELSSGDFLFKIDNQIKKIKLNQILGLDFTPESEEESVNEGYGEYTMTDYLYDISNFIEAAVPDWAFLIGEEGRELIDWLEENQGLWDLQSLFAAGVPSEDVAQNIIEELQEDEKEE